MLHIVNSPPSTVNGFIDIQRTLDSKDAVLLVGDGLYWTCNTTFECPTFALDQHRKTRGLSVQSNIAYVDIAKAVELTENHSPIATW